MSGFEAYVLTPNHLETFQAFTCGSGNEWCDTLNDFLKENALPEGAGLFNKTYVFYNDEAPVAYATLAASEIDRKRSNILFGSNKPHPTIPALQIGRIAVDESCQGQKLGTTVLGWIEKLAVESGIGCRFLVLTADEKNAGAIRLYKRYGFVAPDEINKGRREIIMLYDLIDSQENSRS